MGDATADDRFSKPPGRLRGRWSDVGPHAPLSADFSRPERMSSEKLSRGKCSTQKKERRFGWRGLAVRCSDGPTPRRHDDSRGPTLRSRRPNQSVGGPRPPAPAALERIRQPIDQNRQLDLELPDDLLVRTGFAWQVVVSMLARGSQANEKTAALEAAEIVPLPLPARRRRPWILLAAGYLSRVPLTSPARPAPKAVTHPDCIAGEA